MIGGNTTDEKKRQRIGIGYILSLIIHAFAALLFFSILTSSSEQSAPEAVQGEATLSVSHVRVRMPQQPAAPIAKPPLPQAPRIARPVGHPVVAGVRPVNHHRELSKQNPKAPPNPTPAPRVPLSPAPVPTDVALASPKPLELPAAPVAQPAAVPVVVARVRPTEAPTVAPATPAPTARPTAVPSTAPATPTPTKAPAPVVAATSAPTRAPVTPGPVVQTASPRPSAQPAKVLANSPAPVHTANGVPSPQPSGVPSPSAQKGTAPSPGPKPASSSGPLPVKTKATPAPARPIELPPTPSPAPPKPKQKKALTPSQQHAYADLNARLRGLLPNGPVTPSIKHAGGSAVYIGDPTPPPQILAQTKYYYEPPKRKSSDRVQMWVTSVSHRGPLTVCTGWLVRYPSPAQRVFVSANAQGPLHGGIVPVDNSGPRPQNGFMPIVEENATFACEARDLRPYVAPSASP